MDARDVGRIWDQNADVWTRLTRAGCDVFRDSFNTPGFLEILPPVEGLRGLDMGCGEGHNTRLLRGRGARMTGLDISEVFVAHARAAERGEPQGIHYLCASATALPLSDSEFDFATAFMSLMDMPEVERAVAEAWRVLRPGGFLQFSILHPCFHTPRFAWVRDEAGACAGVVCGDYFDAPQGRIEEWMFSQAEPLPHEPKNFRVPYFPRTLSQWVNLLVAAGFVIEAMGEPRPAAEAAADYPALAVARAIGFFLHVRARKPGAS